MATSERTEEQDPHLSTREIEVMNLLATGMSNAEIGAELYIGVETVKSHLSGIYRKLGVSKRGQAVAWMRERPEAVVDPNAPIATVTTKPTDEGVRVVLAGEFDMTTTALLADGLERVRAAGPASVEIDMAGVSFIDSAGLRELVAFFTREPKPDARVVHPSVSARRVLEFTGLMAMFGVTE